MDCFIVKLSEHIILHAIIISSCKLTIKNTHTATFINTSSNNLGIISIITSIFINITLTKYLYNATYSFQFVLIAQVALKELYNFDPLFSHENR